MANFCRNCGKQAEEGGAFCAACGMSLSTLSPANAPPPGRQIKKVKIWIPIAAIAVVLALVFCGLFFFTDMFKTGDDGTTVGGTTTTSPGTSPGETPSTSPTPENTLLAAPTLETTPPETPAPESVPSETPTPETPPPELPPNHISAEFFDLLRNGDYFYLSYMERPIDGELYGDLQYRDSDYDEHFSEQARQGDLYVYRISTRSVKWHRHYVHMDNKEYAIFHRDNSFSVSDLDPRRGYSPTGVAQGGLAPYVDGLFSLVFVGSGVGAINGVQMIYDDYSLKLFGEDTGARLLVYLYDDKVAYLVDFMDGTPTVSYSFTEVARNIPPLDFDISYAEISRNIPPDIFDIDEFLAKYTFVQENDPPPRPGR